MEPEQVKKPGHLEYVVELSLIDLRRMVKQAKKSPIQKTKLVIHVPEDLKIVAYDEKKGVKGPMEISSDSVQDPTGV